MPAFPRPLALLLAVLGLLAAGFFTVRYVIMDLPDLVAQRATRAAAESAREIAAAVAGAFQIQPQVVIGQRTIVEQRSEVLTLTTVEQTLTERLRMDESWLHSTKTLEVEADFVVRAGFDLEKPFVVRVDAGSGGLRVTLPPAEILGVDVRDVRFLRDESGLWNYLTPEDRERALRELRGRVGVKAREGQLLEQARASAERRLRELLERPGRPVTFEPAR